MDEALDEDYDVSEDDVIEIEIPLEYSDDDLNLVYAFELHEDGQKALKRLAQTVVDTFDHDWDSSEEYRRRAAEDYKVFSGDLPKKEWPYEYSANPNVPIMLENITRLHARLYSEIFGDGTNIAGFLPTGPDDEEQANVLTLHMNWQLREQIRDFLRQMDRGLMAQLILGDVYCHSQWDPVNRRNKHEVLTVDQFVVPYAVVTTQPDLSDLDHHTKILHLSDKELEDKSGDWAGVEEILSEESPSWEDDPVAAFADEVNESMGISAPDSSGPHRILEYEGWLRLPNRPRRKWCKVIVHYETQKIMSLMVHETEDWRDQLRFEREQQEAKDYLAQSTAYDEALGMRDMEAGVLEGAAATEQIVGPEFRAQAMDAAAQLPLPPIPHMPEWMKSPDSKPTPARRVPVRNYSHGVGIENLAGAHGLPVGRIQADHNRAANTVLSQFIDAATANNCSTLLVSDVVEFEKPFTVQPGSVNRVKGLSPEEMSKGIQELRLGAANPQLMDVLELVWQKAQSSIQSPNVLSGEPGKSGETFRGISSRIEQATKQLSVHGRKFANGFLRQVLLNNAKLNAIYLDELEIIHITDWRMKTQRPIAVGRHMYRRSYGVEIRADLRFTSEAQKVDEAMAIYNMVAANPMLGSNVALMYHIVKDILERARRYDLIAYLGPEPPPPETPLAIPPPQPPQGAPPQGQPPQ